MSNTIRRGEKIISMGNTKDASYDIIMKTFINPRKQETTKLKTPKLNTNTYSNKNPATDAKNANNNPNITGIDIIAPNGTNGSSNTNIANNVYTTPKGSRYIYKSEAKILVIGWYFSNIISILK